MPCRRTSGWALAIRSRATPSTVPVWAVARPSVCDRVARVKSSKRSRRTTVRPTRWAARRRRHTRSTSATSDSSTSPAGLGRLPSARCAPIERRRRPTSTGRGSRLWARAWRCRPPAGPSIATSADSGSSATSPTVWTPRACSLSAVTGPTPHNRRTGNGCRNASSPSGGTTSSPSGLATALATLARNFVRATPTVIGSPTRRCTSARSRTAISRGVPAMRHSPATSRNASSMDKPSTSGEVSSNTPNTALLASEYTANRGSTTTACGHSCRACRPPIAVRTPKALAS